MARGVHTCFWMASVICIGMAVRGQNEDLDEVIRTNHSVDVMSHMFAKVDSNGDGMISQEEWALGMQEHPMVLLETSELKEAAIKAGTW
eukprot:CAMPEP_0181469902 /NCGR_PEP_ID=MMETSP1110-20121109/38266_1 /TAXON_ID=174948 /ORGANISM="Symbiodinium sp., Strain CCMP421" /LENGTH=88 /DNA_ID=CAMNT_0023594839 /DNA_START=82 /DNA_END=345 /DNA_ORIENTATION=+